MRYFFDLHDGPNIELDPIGDDFDSLKEVKGVAAALVVEAARIGLPAGQEASFACEVRDEVGRVVHRANLIFWRSRL